MLEGLHHVAYRCLDAAETVDFYTNVIAACGCCWAAQPNSATADAKQRPARSNGLVPFPPSPIC